MSKRRKKAVVGQEYPEVREAMLLKSHVMNLKSRIWTLASSRGYNGILRKDTDKILDRLGWGRVKEEDYESVSRLSAYFDRSDLEGEVVEALKALDSVRDALDKVVDTMDATHRRRKDIPNIWDGWEVGSVRRKPVENRVADLLKKDVIKLANQNPELRSYLVPLLRASD